MAFWLPSGWVTPVAPTRLIPMPVFYDNTPLSLLAVTLFPDDLDLARFMPPSPIPSFTSRS